MHERLGLISTLRLGVMVGCGVATCLGLVACGARQREAAVPAPGRALELAVVGLDARIGRTAVHGSGAVIDARQGLVLTSAHNVWGARSLTLDTALGILHGRIVARAPCDDLALVETYPRIPGLVALRAAPGAPENGELLRSLGRRRADGDAAAFGLASIPVRVTGAMGVEDHDMLMAPPGSMALDTPLVPAVSGGPIVDAAGRLVGLAHVLAKPGHLVPWAVIDRRLRRLRPGPRTLYVGWADQYRCAGRLNAYARASFPGFYSRDARLNAPVQPTRVAGVHGMPGG
jgi:S1-C subfamily serine protease